MSQGVHQQSALQHADCYRCCCLAEALFSAVAVLCFANSDVCFIACCRFLHVTGLIGGAVFTGILLPSGSIPTCAHTLDIGCFGDTGRYPFSPASFNSRFSNLLCEQEYISQWTLRSAV